MKNNRKNRPRDFEIDANKRAAKYFYNGESWLYEQDGYPLSLDRIILL